MARGPGVHYTIAGCYYPRSQRSGRFTGLNTAGRNIEILWLPRAVKQAGGSGQGGQHPNLYVGAGLGAGRKRMK